MLANEATATQLRDLQNGVRTKFETVISSARAAVGNWRPKLAELRTAIAQECRSGGHSDTTNPGAIDNMLSGVASCYQE